MATSQTDETYARPFSDFLREINRGRTHDELSEALVDLVAGVTDTGRAGQITFTLKVSQEKGTSMLKIEDGVTVKMPKLDRPSSMWFVDRAGNPSRHDPAQLEFSSLSAVPTAAPAAVVPTAQEA